MKRSTICAAVLCTALLCACAAPPYRIAPTDQTASVHFVKLESPDICVAGHRFALTMDASGKVSVPAGRPVHLIGSYKDRSGHCLTAVKFVPQAGQAYEVVNDVRAERCIVNVMRHDAASQYGLRVEPSVGATYVCPL